MTVQTFIVNYNYVFQYLHDHFGKAAVVDLWRQISAEFCQELRECIEQDGIEGADRFFYGEDGISAREQVSATHGCRGGVYFEDIVQCPSVHELVKRERKRYRHYCEHCYWLYAPCFAAGGYLYDVEYGLQEEDRVADSCRIRAFRREEEKK